MADCVHGETHQTCNRISQSDISRTTVAIDNNDSSMSVAKGVDMATASKRVKYPADPPLAEYDYEATILALRRITAYQVEWSHICNMTTKALHVRFKRNGNIIAHYYPRTGRMWVGKELNYAKRIETLFSTVKTAVDHLLAAEHLRRSLNQATQF